ncbi:MAG: LysR family transcriptional regulator [Eubacteriales bacterium]
MDLTQLKAFYKVSRCGNFSRAAENLFMSQPALSRQISSLEAAVGMQLFYRNGRGVTLTDAGRRLLPYAETIIANIEEAEKMFNELLNLETGELSLVTCSTVGNYLLPATMADYRQRFPEVKINIMIKNTRDTLKKIMERDVDLGIIPGPIDEPGLYMEPYQEDRLVLTLPPGHPFTAENCTIEPRDFSSQMFLAREPGSHSRELVESFFHKNAITPKEIITLGHTEALKRGVANGMGLAFLPACSIELELKTGLLYRIPGESFELHRELLCVYPKDYRLSPAALAFMALVKKNRQKRG